MPDGTAQLLMCKEPAGDTSASMHEIVVFSCLTYFNIIILSFLDELLGVLPMCFFLFDQQHSCLALDQLIASICLSFFRYGADGHQGGAAVKIISNNFDIRPKTRADRYTKFYSG